MPNKEDSASRHRMVVEEIEIPEKPAEKVPEKVVDQSKSDILDDGAKVSSTGFIDNPRPVSPADTPQEVSKQGSPVVWILIPGIFILGAILGGIFFYQKSVNTISVEESPTPVASTVAIPTPTATPKAVDVSSFDIAVFNGSGIAGEAGAAKTLLTDAGFTVVSTANAATYDYTKTIIKAKSTIDSAVIQKLKDTLSKDYVLGDSQTLSSSSTTDIQVVVGSSKAE